MNTKSWCSYVRKKYGKTLHIYDPVFRQNYYVFIGSPDAFVLEMDKKDISVEKPDGDGAFTSVEHRGYVTGIIFSIDKNRSLIHECLHAAMWGLTRHGISVTENYGEILAYYQSFLYKCVTKK